MPTLAREAATSWAARCSAGWLRITSAITLSTLSESPSALRTGTGRTRKTATAVSKIVRVHLMFGATSVFSRTPSHSVAGEPRPFLRVTFLRKKTGVTLASTMHPATRNMSSIALMKAWRCACA